MYKGNRDFVLKLVPRTTASDRASGITKGYIFAALGFGDFNIWDVNSIKIKLGDDLTYVSKRIAKAVLFIYYRFGIGSKVVLKNGRYYNISGSDRELLDFPVEFLSVEFPTGDNEDSISQASINRLTKFIKSDLLQELPDKLPVTMDYDVVKIKGKNGSYELEPCMSIAWIWTRIITKRFSPGVDKISSIHISYPWSPDLPTLYENIVETEEYIDELIDNLPADYEVVTWARGRYRKLREFKATDYVVYRKDGSENSGRIELLITSKKNRKIYIDGYTRIDLIDTEKASDFIVR